MSEKIRFAFVGDLHADDLRPSSRKDDYLDACVDELNESLEIATTYKCDLYIHAGDMYHRLDPGGICRNRIIETLLHNKNGKPWPFEKYTLLGNHDIKHNITYLRQSAMWTTIKSGAIQYVEEIPEYRIGFEHFRSTIDEDLLGGCLLSKDNLICCLHANITLGDFFEGTSFAPLKKIPTNPATKLLLSGHIHYPLEGGRPDGLKFVNPGSLCRNSLMEYNRTRIPQILIVEYSLDGSYLKYEYVPLTVSRPAEDIFFLEEIQRKKDAEEDMSAYIKEISQVTRYNQTTGKIASLKDMAKMHKVTDEVVEKAVTKLIEVNEKRGIHLVE